MVSSVLHRNIHHAPRSVSGSNGNYITLKDGSEILDACGGAAVVSIGHADPRVIKGMHETLNAMTFVHSGEYGVPVAEELADLLCESAGMSRAAFFSSGSEGIETAIKMARHFHIENGQPQRVNFISRDLSYHGNLLGGLALSGHQRRRAPYEPLLSPNFHKVTAAHFYRFGRPGETEAAFVERLAAELEAKIVALGSDTVAAFFVEPVVGAALGCVPCPDGYLTAVRRFCDRHGVLLVYDEVMSGSGRTGYLHAWQHEGVPPDIQVSAKGLSSGYAPLSAVMINRRVFDVFAKGSGTFVNGQTYQSHVLSCRAGLEVMKIIQGDQLVARCRLMGHSLERHLRQQLGDHPNVGDIRGRGLFWGVEFVADRATRACLPIETPVSEAIGEACFRRGVAVYGCAKGTADGLRGDHLLVAPPYTVTKAECQRIAEVLREAIYEVLPPA